MCVVGKTLCLYMLYSYLLLLVDLLIADFFGCCPIRVSVSHVRYTVVHGNVSNKIACILRKCNIRTVHLPPKKIKQMLRPVKDEQGLKTPGVYEIPCECGQIYIGQTGCTVSERISEHERDLRM